MDFNAFDSRTAADKGAPLHICHPVTGEPIFDGDKPCIVLVRGGEGRAAQAAAAAARAAREAEVKPDPKASAKPKTMDELHNDLVRTAKPLIIGFENVMRGDRPATAEDAGWFLDLNMINGQEGERSFAEQVLAFATRRANYLGNVLRP